MLTNIKKLRDDPCKKGAANHNLALCQNKASIDKEANAEAIDANVIFENYSAKGSPIQGENERRSA